MPMVIEVKKVVDRGQETERYRMVAFEVDKNENPIGPVHGNPMHAHYSEEQAEDCEACDDYLRRKLDELDAGPEVELETEEDED